MVVERSKVVCVWICLWEVCGRRVVAQQFGVRQARWTRKERWARGLGREMRIVSRMMVYQGVEEMPKIYYGVLDQQLVPSNNTNGM